MNSVANRLYRDPSTAFVRSAELRSGRRSLLWVSLGEGGVEVGGGLGGYGLGRYAAKIREKRCCVGDVGGLV